MFKNILLALVLFPVASLCYAADNPLSVHVLNTQNGLPAAKVQVTLEQMKGDTWVELNSAITNQQGRIAALYPDGKSLTQGTYRVTFETGDWFKQQGIQSFFPEVPVVFSVDGKLSHYHIPLLLSPFAYSTYRGN